MRVEVFNETNESLTNDIKELKKLLKSVCDDEKLGDGEFNVILVDTDSIQELNRKYRNIDRITDVISFALEDEKSCDLSDYRMLGDIYICLAKAREQALEYGHSFKRELSFLAIHGFLHLLGYDHIEKDDEKKMFQKQEEVLSKYGIER